MPRKVFVAGEILTAADVNTNLMDQAVMVFDDATARTTAIPTPVEGMVTYLKTDDEVTVFDGSAFKAVGPGKILQVVQTVKDDGFTTASTSLTDVTGFAVTITPSSATSNVLLIATIGTLDVSEPSGLRMDFQRGTTSIGIGDTGTRLSISVVSDQNRGRPGAWSFLDSPATTSATTYKGRMNVTSGTGHFNRDFGGGVRTIATLTAMEVAG